MSSDTEFFNGDRNDLSNMVDDEIDDDHGGTINFTATDTTTEAMKNVNDKSRRIIALPTSDYFALRPNDVEFILDPADTDENISQEKIILSDEAFPTDLDESKCDDFKYPIGYYVILGCGNISSDAQIKNTLMLEKATFHRISLENRPDKSSNPKYHNKSKVANIKYDMVNT